MDSSHLFFIHFHKSLDERGFNYYPQLPFLDNPLSIIVYLDYYSVTPVHVLKALKAWIVMSYTQAVPNPPALGVWVLVLYCPTKRGW